MPQVKFTKFGANSAFGGFGPGDLLRCSDALAAHLVNEAQVAQYVEPKSDLQAELPVEPVPSEPSPRKRKSK